MFYETFLTEDVAKRYQEFLDWVKENVEPYAKNWEESGISAEIISECGQTGYLGGLISEEFGGRGWNCLTYGLLNEAISTSSVSLASLFNVHTMASQIIQRWGNDAQKKKWLSDLSTGKKIGAFALTEPSAGSDMKGIETEFTTKGDHIIINGTKRWITFGNRADLFLVFGKVDGKPTACVVERDAPGFKSTPITNMLGFRGAHMGILTFENCIVSQENLIGSYGFGFSHIANYGLEFGRLSVAFAGLGILRGSLIYVSQHSQSRKTFSETMIQHDMIKRLITKMGVDFQAATHLCFQACTYLDRHDIKSAERVMTAKYYTTTAAAEHAAQAVQILGAIGCREDHPVARYYRDAKILEVVEGSTQIQELVLGWKFANRYGKFFR